MPVAIDDVMRFSEVPVLASHESIDSLTLQENVVWVPSVYECRESDSVYVVDDEILLGSVESEIETESVAEDSSDSERLPLLYFFNDRAICERRVDVSEYLS